MYYYFVLYYEKGMTVQLLQTRMTRSDASYTHNIILSYNLYSLYNLLTIYQNVVCVCA